MRMKEQIAPVRGAGVLAHIASLPGRYGIGTLGKSAFAFADRLAETGIRYWQVLPLVQTGFGDSPYQSVYSGSGNPYLIDLQLLVEQGLLKKNETEKCRQEGPKIDYEFLYREKIPLLRRAFERFDRERRDFVDFVESERFEDYALFMTGKTVFGNLPFTQWDRACRFREETGLARLKREHYDEYLFWQFLQFVFERQWRALKTYANERDVRIIGDMPLYVAADSADVWANPQLFRLQRNLTPAKVAGVPPDYFSKTGQLWGNPVYDWPAHKKQKYEWWIGRVRRAFKIYDIVRIDHFRGFDRYFEIDAAEKTAEHGVWKPGPKEEFFRALRESLGDLPLIAEDLGILDEGVIRLLENVGFPGMKILLFAFDGNENNAYLPKNIVENSVCYTGTHDNETAFGYVGSLSDGEFTLFAERVARAARSLGVRVDVRTRASVARALCTLALASGAKIAVLPLQDILGLGNESRMNTPATAEGNWQFRLQKMPTAEVWKKLKRAIGQTGRNNQSDKPRF